MPKDVDDNPSLRERFGKRVAERIKAQAKVDRQQRQFKDATRRFRPRKAELGKVVLLAATKTRSAKPGDRVEPSYKGKVFALYVTRTKKVKPYREKVYKAGKRPRAKGKTVVPYRPTALDPQQFPTRAARKAAGRILLARGDSLVPAARIVAVRGNVAWHETVVPIAAQKMQDLASKATGGKGAGDLPMVVQADVTVQMDDGSRKTIRVQDDFGQRREQGAKQGDFYTPFLGGKLYMMVAEQLSILGLVSQGSARRVQKANKGLPRSKWKWRGGPWHKRDLKVARVAEVVFKPMLKRVTVGAPSKTKTKTKTKK